MGFEQLIWAVLILIFLVVSALKNFQKQKKRTGSKPVPTKETPKRRPKSDEEVRGFFEELMGIERPKERPPIRYETEEAVPPVAPKRPKRKPRFEEEPSEVPKGLLVQLRGLETPPPSEEPKTVKRPVILPKGGLRNAIILSEIIGPPIAKRKTHRLF
jgi:hypothetical protein